MKYSAQLEKTAKLTPFRRMKVTPFRRDCMPPSVFIIHNKELSFANQLIKNMSFLLI